jgi:hypothetical protein
MLHTVATMGRRLGILTLAAAVGLPGLAFCPRGVMACGVARQASHDCCKHRTSLRSDDCCCGAQRTSVQTTGAALQEGHASAGGSVTALHWVVPTTAPPRTARAWFTFSHGLGPPDTPITQHTQLLL